MNSLKGDYLFPFEKVLLFPFEKVLLFPFEKVLLFPPLEKGAGGFNEGGTRIMQNKSSIDEKEKSHPTFTLGKEGVCTSFSKGNGEELMKS